jgi:hypothetical protein
MIDLYKPSGGLKDVLDFSEAEIADLSAERRLRLASLIAAQERRGCGQARREDRRHSGPSHRIPKRIP